MKQSRRQELKTNELSVYLKQAYDFLSRNATYVLGAAVVVALIIIVGTLNARSQRRARADAAARLDLIQSGEVTRDAKLLDELKDMAANYGSDPGLGPEILDMQASLAHQLALNLTTEADKARRAELLKEAKAACEQAIRTFSNRADVVARARLVMATVEETLFMDHQGDLEQVRGLYKQIIDGPPNPYKELAEQKLETLAERTEPLQIVSTRPAPTRPAIAQPVSPTTKPAVPATMPGKATTPATGTAKPATAPAGQP